MATGATRRTRRALPTRGASSEHERGFGAHDRGRSSDAERKDGFALATSARRRA